jgi:type I restriction enzyme S subunit
MRLLPEYMNWYVRTEVGKSFLSGRAVRTADGKFNINSGTIRKVLVPIPKIDEQEEIASKLNLIEQKINLHKQKQFFLQELFRTLLHQLMTGEVRTADLRGFEDFADVDDADLSSAQSGNQP